ncbi:WD repeat-containing protein 31-like [Mytilus edulis]|uniref:WD repeat-containing protein 31-like n=1 Tax=Mytilus edulis TaxID=6550 RepID=UPI0039EF528B
MGNLCRKPKDNRQSIGFDNLENHTGNAGDHCSSPMDKYAGRHTVETSHPAIHSEAVNCLAKIQPGFCLSGSKDQTLCLYNYCTNKLEDKWTGHEKEVTKICYGTFCQSIFSASRDKSINMWKRNTPNPVQQFKGHDLVVTALDINKDNTMLCSGSRDNTVKLWDVESGTSLTENNIHRNLVTDVKFIPDSNLIVQTGEDKEVRLFDTRSLNVVHSFQRKQYIQTCCDVSPDGVYCLTCSNGFGGNGCEATLWDLRSRSIVHEYKGHTEAIDSCVFLPYNGTNLIATASRDFSVKIWDRDSKACICECVISGSGPLTSILCYGEPCIIVSSFNLGIQHLKFSLQNQTLIKEGSF